VAERFAKTAARDSILGGFLFFEKAFFDDGRSSGLPFKTD
jgi:hypothetical protein